MAEFIYEEMAKKTVVRRLFKMLPTSIELSEALSIEEKQISDSDGELIEGDFSIGEEEKFEQAVTENESGKETVPPPLPDPA